MIVLTTIKTYELVLGACDEAWLRGNQTCTKSWLPFRVAFAPLFPKGHWPFSGTGNPPPLSPPRLPVGSLTIYNVQMDAAVLGDRLPKGTQKPLLGPGSPSLQCRHWESPKVLAGLAFCEMLLQYSQSASQGFCGGHQRRSAAVCDPNPPRPFARCRYYFYRISCMNALFSPTRKLGAKGDAKWWPSIQCMFDSLWLAITWRYSQIMVYVRSDTKIILTNQIKSSYSCDDYAFRT